MKTYVVLAIAVFAQATGNVYLSKGMKQIASAAIKDCNVLFLFSRAVESPTIWLGTALLIVFSLLFVAALSWADLTFVLPAISAQVIVNVAFADYFLNEPVSPVRWAGTLLISTGIILVLISGKKTVRSDSKMEKSEDISRR